MTKQFYLITLLIFYWCKFAFSQDSIFINLSIQKSAHGVFLMNEKYYTYPDRLNYKCGTYEGENYITETNTFGFYKNNLKEGVWYSVDVTSHDTIYVGQFVDGVATGQWRYFEFYDRDYYSKLPYEELLKLMGKDFKPKLIQVIDMDKMEQIFPQRKVMKGATVIMNNDTLIKDLTKEPVMIGGEAAFYLKFKSLMKYPDLARENGKSGKLYAQITINDNGTVSDFKIWNELGYGFEEELTRVIDLIKDDWLWLPGEINNRKVKTRLGIPFSFNLN